MIVRSGLRLRESFFLCLLNFNFCLMQHLYMPLSPCCVFGIHPTIHLLYFVSKVICSLMIKYSKY